MGQHLFRFFAEKDAAGLWHLAEDEIAHARKVLRIMLGDTVEVCDGRGQVAVGKVEAVSGSAICVRAESEVVRARSEQEIVLLVGALKPSSMDDILPGLIELGVDRICIFAQAGAASYRLDAKVQNRWSRIACAATKQCKRPWLPEIDSYPSLARALAGVCKDEGDIKIYFDHEAEGVFLAGDEQQRLVRARRSIVAIGGEAGWQVDERQAFAAAGFAARKLHTPVLRATTATISVCAAIAVLRSAKLG